MPRKGTPDNCPKCADRQLARAKRERHIDILCLGCKHRFKSRSVVARRNWGKHDAECTNASCELRGWVHGGGHRMAIMVAPEIANLFGLGKRQ